MRMRMFDECWTRREWLDFSSATTGACEQALRWVQILFKRKRTARLFHDSELKWNGDSSMDVYRGEEPRRSRDGRVVTASDATTIKQCNFVQNFSKQNKKAVLYSGQQSNHSHYAKGKIVVENAHSEAEICTVSA
jgi:hypothetical protein